MAMNLPHHLQGASHFCEITQGGAALTLGSGPVPRWGKQLPASAFFEKIAAAIVSIAEERGL